MASGAVLSMGGPAVQASAPATGSNCPSTEVVTYALQRGSNALANGRAAEALNALQPLAGLPCDPRIPLLLAGAYEGNGDLPRALDTLQQAHITWAANDDIAASLARLYLDTTQPAKAAEALASFHASQATPPQQISVAVVAYLATHQLSLAEAAAHVGYEAHASIPSLLLYANTLQMEGRYKDVISLLQGKREQYGKSAPFLVTLAQSEYDASMFQAAESDVRKATSIDPSVYAAHYLLGNILLKLGSPEAAEAEYRTAVGVAPNQPRTYYYLALALRAEHKETDEEPILSKAISIDAHYALAHCEMGRILLNQDRVSEAVTQLTQAVQENGSNEQAYYLLARAYERQGKTDEAEKMKHRLAEIREANHRSQDGQGRSTDALTPPASR